MKLIIESSDHEALRAAEVLRSYCADTSSCARCIFYGDGCMLRNSNAEDWDLPRVYDLLAKGGSD